MLDDEEEALAAADMQSQVAAEEAARAVRRAQAKGDGSMDERVARLQQRAKAASERAAALRLVIEGPQPPEVSSHASCGQSAAHSWVLDLVSDTCSCGDRRRRVGYGHTPAIAWCG